MNIKYSLPCIKLDAKKVNGLIFLLLNFYLIIDMLNGFFLLAVGLDVKLSVAYKALILLLILSSWLSKNVYNLLWFLLFVTILLLGESASIFSGRASGEQFGFIFQHIIKLATPFLAFFWLRALVIENPQYLNNIHRVMKINVLVFVANILLGVAGFGFSTYGGNVSDTSIGVKGFFYAGNEVSMLWIVMSAYFMNIIYQKYNKFAYLAFALFAIYIGLMIATKTAILATFILFLAIPVVIERTNLFDLSKGVSYFFIAVCTLAVIAGFQAYFFILESNLYSRLDFFFRKNGLIGILLSGRDTFLIELNSLFFSEDSIFRVLFGLGVSFYADKTKYSVELDFPDIFFWHGIVGVLLIFGCFINMTNHALRHMFSANFPNAGVVLMTNMALLCVANLSGHVFTSGMLGIIWACFCATSLQQTQLTQHAHTHH